MKTHIIHLDPHDDHVSACDKLGWAQAGRVVLVWPKEGRPLTRRLDLVLLERRARAIGTQLGLVTLDPEVLEHARDLHIPVFQTPDSIPEEGWRRRGRRPLPGIQRSHSRPDGLSSPRPRPGPRQLSSPARIVVFSLPMLALLAVAATAFPSATITLDPVTSSHVGSFVFWLDPTLREPRADGRIPAETVSGRVRGEQRLTTTGAVTVESTSATGEVTLTNVTDEPVSIPAGTGLRASAVPEARFVTLEDVDLDAGESDTTRVRAVSPGASGNVAAGAIDAVEGEAAFLVEVTNEGATAGGSEAHRAAVAPSDRTRLLQQLTSDLLTQAGLDLVGELEPGQVLAPASLRTVRELERTFSAEVGQAADSLRLALELEVTAYAYRLEDLEASAELAAAGELGDRALAAGSLALELDGDFAAAPDGRYRASGVALWQTYDPPDAAALIAAVAGRPPAEAAAAVEAAVELQDAPAIRISPSWFPLLPWLRDRITIEIARAEG